MVIGESVTAVQRVSLSSFCLNTFLYVFIECFLRVFYYGAAMQTFLHQRSMKSLSFTLAWRWSDYQLECEKAHEWQMTSGRAGLCLLSTFEAGWSMVSSLACRCKSNESKKKEKERNLQIPFLWGFISLFYQLVFRSPLIEANLKWIKRPCHFQVCHRE